MGVSWQPQQRNEAKRLENELHEVRGKLLDGLQKVFSGVYGNTWVAMMS